MCLAFIHAAFISKSSRSYTLHSLLYSITLFFDPLENCKFQGGRTIVDACKMQERNNETMYQRVKTNRVMIDVS